MITIQKQSDMEQYYDKASSTYQFAEGGSLQDVDIKCDISIHAHINAGNINAWDINAWDINAWNINACDIDSGNIDARNINAWNINAWNISYYAVCIAYRTMRCRSIQGGRHNAIHACLDNDIEYKEADPC